jgi:phosphoribosyl-AMP cyclohydrolase / phosphoribosyl-ATP pyrophosphohydrolase
MNDIRPLVILAEDGGCIDAALMNGKGFRKSRERGELWIVHQDTGRLLPYEEKRACLSLKDNGSWYEAVVPSEPSAAGSEEARTGGRGAAPGVPGEGASVSGTAAESGESVLEELAALIRERREKKPEGSYTTYLFKEGAEKIRKKTGEEAVELILARGREEIVYEASDLVYHLLVLLEAEGISLEEVLHELRGRR